MSALVALIFVGTFGLGVMAQSSFWRGGREARCRRRMQRSPTVRIADAKRGSVIKIVGIAEAVEPLIEAPLSGRSAIAFAARVEIIEELKDGRSAATPYRREVGAQDFLVRDESGVALVRVRRADVVAETESVAGDERGMDWLRRRHGHARFLGVRKRTFRFYEAALVPGAEVVVLGRCAAQAAVADEGPYRNGGEPMITIDAPTAGPVLLSWGA